MAVAMTCVRYLVFFFNFLFAITGLFILVIGALIQSSYYHYSNFLGDSFWSAPIILMIIGSIVFIVAFFGCCGTAKENSCLILTFSIFLVLIFVAEIGIGIAGYIKHGQLESILEVGFNKTLNRYENNLDAQKAWTLVQAELECCGIRGPTDWEPIFKNDTLPKSCCHQFPPNVNKCTKAYSAKDGCLMKLNDFLGTKSMILAGIGIGIAIIQLLGVVFACCLYRSFRASYETV